MKIDKAAIRTPAVFGLIAREGNVPERDMFNTFNMGVGMTVTVSAKDADRALALLHENGIPDAYILGGIVPGEKEVILC